jgi:predicted dehydrogenase
MTRITTGLLLGYGSVGRRHARTLAALTPRLAIVEAAPAARADAEATYPGAQVVERLEMLDQARPDWAGSVGVIATWGPSHAEFFHALADRGVRRILCEKPMAASVSDAEGMVTRAEDEGIVLGVHHYLRYAGVVPALRACFEEHALGDPVAVVVEGGAACLLTNGIHWLDFAVELFGAPPVRVVSTAAGEPLNPRSPDLRLYGGTAIWSFEGGREAVISLSNRSSVSLSTRIYLRDAVAELDGDLNLVLRRRDPAAVARFPAVTRTGPASEPLFAGRLPSIREYLDGMRTAAAELVEGGPVTCAGDTGAAAVMACVAALISARDRRAVELPLERSDPLAREWWPIS